MNNQKNYVGVWLDQRGAYIITQSDDKIAHHIESNLEDFHLQGGYGGSTKYLGQDASSQTKLTSRKNHQLHGFFEDIIKLLPELDALYIFGPGETKKHFRKEVENVVELRSKIVAVETADKLTPNQMRSQVRDFFNRNIH